MTAILKQANIVKDPFALEEILIFVRSSFNSEALISKNAKLPENTTSHFHYLSNLQGCSFNLMSTVQISFIRFYSTLTDILTELLKAWHYSSRTDVFPESVYSPYLYPIKLILNFWTIQFSSRDQCFLSESKFLSTLFDILDMDKYEIMTSESDQIYTSLLNLSDKVSNEYFESLDIKLLSPTMLKKKLKQGTLNFRRLLLIMKIHSQVYYKSQLDNGNTLCYDKNNFCREELSSIMNLYENINNSMIQQKEEEEATLKSEKKEKYMILNEKILGVKKETLESSLFNFDSDKKAPNILLEEYDSVATIESFDGITVAAVFGKLEYNLSLGPELTGNYFEVEILKIGSKEIGVGLACRDSFRLINEMPGWNTSSVNSYGYHGDDGNLFGEDKVITSSLPLWSAGDVIGLGINFESRTIFYTRNGELLGTAFRAIPEDVIFSPVVGFHKPNGNNEPIDSVTKSVRINYGLLPFKYDDPKIIIHPGRVLLILL